MEKKYYPWPSRSTRLGFIRTRRIFALRAVRNSLYFLVAFVIFSTTSFSDWVWLIAGLFFARAMGYAYFAVSADNYINDREESR